MLVNLNNVLLPARQGGYAVGLFNTVNLELARGVLAAAEELRSPVIIGTAQILLPYGPLEELSDLLIPMAKRAPVPVVVHLDHGLDGETCRQALKLGFPSVMYDCSTDTYGENVRKVRELTSYAHSLGASVEAELGHVGSNGEDEEGNYTDPLQAKEFAGMTGVDALAVAVGTAHGTYHSAPKLDFDRIEQIRRETGIPLVLHGGSGLSNDDFRQVIRRGISKINIFTDINQTGARAACENYRPGCGLTDLIPYTVDAVKTSVKEKMNLFGSAGRA